MPVVYDPFGTNGLKQFLSKFYFSLVYTFANAPFYEAENRQLQLVWESFFCEQLIFGLDFLSTLFNNASSAAPKIPLCRKDVGIEPRTLRLWH